MQLWDSEPEQPDDFIAAARLFARLRWKGIRVPSTDCLIAAVAIRRKLPLFARGGDFDHIPQLQRHYL
jgi:predicted nucleic acid-binding protein